MGVNMSEGDGQLPEFPPREHDRESVERSEKQDRKRGWLTESISLIVDLISSWR
jgi:hypothetical protein